MTQTLTSTSDARQFVETHGKAAINTLTKYPSILTLHELGEKGKLTDTLTITTSLSEYTHISEKIDGTNVRLIVFPDGSYLIGGRENILHASGDLYFATDNDIVESLRSNYRLDSLPKKNLITILYGELYGGRIGSNAKQYGVEGTGFRVFDVASMGVSKAIDLCSTLSLPELSLWREKKRGSELIYGQPFVNKGRAERWAAMFGFEFAPIETCEPPADTSIEGVYSWLSSFAQSRAKLFDTGGGRSEGLVLSTPDRSRIVKVRLEDYERTLRKRN